MRSSRSHPKSPRRAASVPVRKRGKRRARRRKGLTFLQAIVRITALFHVPVAFAMVGAARALDLPQPSLIGAAVAFALFLPFPWRARHLFPDRPRSRLMLHLVDEPYFVHWCAALGAAIPIALAFTLVPLGQLVWGHPLRFPFGFAAIAYGLTFALALWGVFIRRRWVKEREVEIEIPGLPQAFDGYRIAQLSDLHIGGLTPRAFGESWAKRANAHGADLVAVTGDMVTSGTAFHEDIATVVGKLEAPDGVMVAMGNHDYFGEGQPLVGLLRDKGARVLRNEGVTVEREGDKIYVAGIDDNWSRRDNIAKALSEREEGMVTILLAHDPVMFPKAKDAGIELTLAGHTHGGQVALPFFPRILNLANLTHKHFLGLYREGTSALYVHAGLGTTGPPVRLGVAPEIAILVLRAA